MKIRSAWNILREIRYMRSVIKCYSDRLAAGKYIVLDGFRAMALNDEETLRCARYYFTKPGVNHRMASIAARLNKSGYYVNKNKKSNAEYEAVYTANNYDKDREIKLFSFKRNKILTVCTSSNEMEKQIAQYESFGSAYSMPGVKKSESYPNSFEISMIALETFPGDYAALHTISRSTVGFNPEPDGLKREKAEALIKHSYDSEEIISLLNTLSSQIDESVLKLEIPLCIQHGDLSKDNLLYGNVDGKSDFWWIDWEHAGERAFFYDYFFYIINSALYYDTKSYDLYMSGGVDENLKNFFLHFGLTFEPEKRRDYFILFAIVFLKERVCDFGRVAALKTYCEFIETH